MSLTFSQICDKIDRVCNTTSDTYTTAQKTVDINLALDEVFLIALKNNGWNVDDWNQTDYPIITTDLVSGQRDYAFIRDESGNLVLNIYKVMIKGSDGVYKNLEMVDQQSETPITMVNGQNTTGTPTCYDKTANAIFLDVIPSYNSTDGLKIFIDREPTYFLSTDTTKVAGIDGLVHDYLYLKPAYEYARDKTLENREAIYRDLLEAKKKVDERYGRRNKDDVKRFVPFYQNNK